MSNELFYIEGGQKKDAALQEEILANREADLRLSRRAVDRAIAQGMTEREAMRFYGPPPLPEE